jgi:hypothetical protein
LPGWFGLAKMAKAKRLTDKTPQCSRFNLAGPF